MERAFLKFVLLSKFSIKSVQKYCADKTICDRHKDITAKKLLSLSGYKTPDNPVINPVTVLEDLIKFSKNLKEKDPENPLKPTEEMKRIVGKKGSLQTRAYFAYNGFVLPKVSIFDDIRNTGTRVLELSNNSPNISRALEVGKGLLNNSVVREQASAFISDKINSSQRAKTTPKKAKGSAKSKKKTITKTIAKSKK
jgi:hypothetical protein